MLYQLFTLLLCGVCDVFFENKMWCSGSLADSYFTNMFQTGWPNHLLAKAIHTENLGFDTSQGPKVFCSTQKMTWTCIDHMTETSLFGWFEPVKTKYIKIWCCRTISKIGHAKIWFHRDSEADVMLFFGKLCRLHVFVPRGLRHCVQSTCWCKADLNIYFYLTMHRCV